MAKPLVDDALWELIEPVLPPPKPRRFRHPGRRPLGNRQTLAGILFVLKTGIAWEDLPAEMGCGSGMSCWRRLRDWSAAGVWERVHRLLLDKLHQADRIDWSRALIDSASVRALKGGPRPAPAPPTAARGAPSTTCSPTRPARRWRRASPAPTATT